MEDKELTISDILDVNVKVKLVERPQANKNSCENCILHSLCGDATILKSDLCFRDVGDGKDWVYVFENVEE